MMDGTQTTNGHKSAMARELILNELYAAVENEVHAEQHDIQACNRALAVLNAFLFKEYLGEQCAFMCMRGCSNPSGIAYFTPAGRRYPGSLGLLHMSCFAADINEDRTITVRKSRLGCRGEFSNLTTVEWLPGHPGFNFTTYLEEA